MVSGAIEGWKNKIPSKFWKIASKFSSEFLNPLGLAGDPLWREDCSPHPCPVTSKIVSAATFGGRLTPLDSDPANNPVLDSPAATPWLGRLLQTMVELRINTIQTFYPPFDLRHADFPPPIQELVFTMVPFSDLLSTNKCWQDWSCFPYTGLKFTHFTSACTWKVNACLSIFSF